MIKFGLYPFEYHLQGLEEETMTSLLNLRTFIKGLGNSVIEEVRPHRIVYAKSLTFRTFLDIQPKRDCLIISLRKGRDESSINYTVKTAEEIENVKLQIANAYENIK